MGSFTVNNPVTATQVTPRARLCYELAEALAEPPTWLSKAGCQWPLFEAAIDVAQQDDDPALRAAIADLSVIKPESLHARHRRYKRLFLDVNRPSLRLYESMARDGHLAGPHTFAVRSIYASAGLVVDGSELPDHVSMELAFVAYLIDQEAQDTPRAAKWKMARRQFMKLHAGQWLPAMGEALTASGDPVYGPIGHLLAVVLRRELRSRRRPASPKTRGLPVLPDAEKCNLCGFCVQVCPTRALAIHETAEKTTLLLTPPACIACERCVRTCETGALQIEQTQAEANPLFMRQSKRVRCLGCGMPTVSQAELQAVAARIGEQMWLNYCLECRALLNGVVA